MTKTTDPTVPARTSNLPAAARSGAPLPRPTALATFFQGLADPTRVRILELLRERPRTVSELVEELGIAQGRVSSHLACLRWCGYVVGEVDGRYTRYRLVDERVRTILELGEAIVRDNAARLTSCLVLATEAEPAPLEPAPARFARRRIQTG